jgi:Cu+-exporting ATPase
VSKAIAQGLEAGRGSVTDFKALAGRGVEAQLEGQRLILGNHRLIEERGLCTPVIEAQLKAQEAQGRTVTLLADTREVLAIFAVADTIKDSSREAIAQMHALGVVSVMLTGDNWTTAKAVARRLGIDEVEAEVLPDQKSAVVARHKAAGEVVAMAGDGVNDAPALAAADVGIAMGTGTDVAMESAGVTLLKGDLNGIVRARRLSEAVMGNIRQNLFFAFIYNALGVPVAAGVLYPFLGILLSPIIAAAAMALSSVSVIANAARLRRVKL